MQHKPSQTGLRQHPQPRYGAAMSVCPRIVISYGRADGEELAIALGAAFEAAKLEYRVDHIDMKGGEDWRRQFEAWVRSALHMVLLMTPAALASGHCAWEWQVARSVGLGVHPVWADQPQAAQMGRLRRWMRQTHQYNWAHKDERTSLMRAVEANPERRRVPDMSGFINLQRHIERPAVMRELHRALLDLEQEAKPVVVGLQGAAGYGKTELAAHIAQDAAIREAYFDGILYARLGKEPVNLQVVFNSLINALRGESRDRSFDSVNAARDAFAAELLDRYCLLVLDDAWRYSDILAFLPQVERAGAAAPEDRPPSPNLSLLITTRDLRTLPAGTNVVPLAEMQPTEAESMLTRGLPMGQTALAKPLMTRIAEQRFGCWPLLLDLGNGHLAGHVRRGATVLAAAEQLDAQLQRSGIDEALRREAGSQLEAEYDRRRINLTLGLSIDLLDETDRQRYRELCVFALDPLPTVAAAARLWGVDVLDAEPLCGEFADMALLRHYKAGAARFGLHQAVRDVLTERLGAAVVATLHARLAAAWRREYGNDWLGCHDDYALGRLPWHFVQAGDPAGLRALLLDPRWIAAKLDVCGVGPLLEDYRSYTGEQGSPAGDRDSAPGLIGRALDLAAAAIGDHPAELPVQLLGRLASDDAEGLTECLATARGMIPNDVLFPLRPTFTPPGAEVRKFIGHKRSVYCVAALSAERIVSGSSDSKLRLWNVETGHNLQFFEGHTDQVWSVAVLSPERIVSGSLDGTLRLWDVASGQELRRFETKPELVDCVAALSAEGIVSGSGDGTLRLWNVVSGRELRRFAGHTGPVICIAVLSPERIISGSQDSTLRLWDVTAGRELRRFKGHTHRVSCVSVVSDERIISGSYDGTLRLWDIASGRELCRFVGHTDAVQCVAVLSPERAVSGSNDGTLRLWELTSGHELSRLEGHTGQVTCVAMLSPERIVSGARDTTLRLWDVATGRQRPRFERHAGSVTCVAALSGARIVSGSYDGRLRLWDAASGRELHRFEEHTSWVRCLAVMSADRVVSGSHDGSLRAWDTASGREIHRFEGHSLPVICLAALSGGRIVSGSADSLRLWDVDSGRELRRFEASTVGISCVTVLTTEHVVTGSNDGRLRMWDMASGHELRCFEKPTGSVISVVALSEAHIVSTWNGFKRDAVRGRDLFSISLWDVASGRELQQFEGHTGLVRCVAVLSPERIVSGSEDGTLRLWDVTTGVELQNLTLDRPITALVVDADGAVVAGDSLGYIHTFRLAKLHPHSTTVL
jgi:WD40 repeat protein